MCILHESVMELAFTMFFFPRYLSRIVKINEGDSKVLIHFDGWNSRHDRWLTYDSELLRPVSKQIAKDQDSPSSEKVWFKYKSPFTVL